MKINPKIKTRMQLISSKKHLFYFIIKLVFNYFEIPFKIVYYVF